MEEENFVEYEKRAGEADNPGVRSMFRFLADEERKHIHLIKDKLAQFNLKQ